MLKVYNNVCTYNRKAYNKQTDRQTGNNNNKETVFVGLGGLCWKLETYILGTYTYNDTHTPP